VQPSESWHDRRTTDHRYTGPGTARSTCAAAEPHDTSTTSADSSWCYAKSRPADCFVLLVVVLLGLGLLALLFLNTASAQDAFRLSDLQRQSKALADQEQSLTQQAANLSNPASVAAAASKLGMVPGAVPIFLGPGQKAPAGEIIGGMLVVPAPRSTAPSTQATKSTAKPLASKKPASTNKPLSPAETTALRNLYNFKKYADWVASHPQAGKGTTSPGTHP
jgi:Tfp pilus assembly protein PilV